MVAHRLGGKRCFRTLRVQETSRYEENLQLLETIALADNRVIILRRNYSHAHSLWQLNLFGEFFDDSCYPLASLDEHVDPLVLVRSMSIALGMVTTNSYCW